MKGAARFLFGALLGAALGYAFALLANRGQQRPQRTVRLAARRARSRRPEPEAAEETAAS